MKHLIDTNITGTLYLIHRVGNDMLRRSAGRILITGSIAGFTPRSFQAAYNGSEAFLNSFSFALRDELRDSGVTVTCLMSSGRCDRHEAKCHRGRIVLAGEAISAFNPSRYDPRTAQRRRPCPTELRSRFNATRTLGRQWNI